MKLLKKLTENIRDYLQQVCSLVQQSENSFQQRRKECIYKMYRCCSPCKRICYEDGNESSGKCR